VEVLWGRARVTSGGFVGRKFAEGQFGPKKARVPAAAALAMPLDRTPVSSVRSGRQQCCTSPTRNGGRCDGVERVSGSGASAVSVITAKTLGRCMLGESREAKTQPSPRVIIVGPKQLAGALSLGEDRHRAFGFEQRQSNVRRRSVTVLAQNCVDVAMGEFATVQVPFVKLPVPDQHAHRWVNEAAHPRHDGMRGDQGQQGRRTGNP
jgi:hypothetical protein